MRRTVIIAACCLFAASQAGLASTIVFLKLSKPDTGYSAFTRDRAACIQEMDMRLGHRRHGATFFAGFTECMKGRGYGIDPHGYRAFRYYVDDAGNFERFLPDFEPPKPVLVHVPTRNPATGAME